MKLKNALLVAIVGGILAAGISFMLPDTQKGDNQNQVVPTALNAGQKAASQRAHPAAPSRTKPQKSNSIPLSPNKASGPSPGNPISSGKLNWLHIQDAGNLKNAEEKMYFVDVYTDWCGWCKVMDKKTFSDPAVQQALNDNFHVVKFNAEQKEAIEFNGASYNWVNAGRKGVNTLAQEFLGARMSYPSFVYLDKNLKVVKVTRGFKDPDKFLAELKMITG